MKTSITYPETLDKDSKEYKDRFTVKITKPRKCTNTWGRGFVIEKASSDELSLSRSDKFRNSNTAKRSCKTYYGE